LCGLVRAIALFSGPSLAGELKGDKEPKTCFSFFLRLLRMLPAHNDNNLGAWGLTTGL
jgi:hypothetical protein